MDKKQILQFEADDTSKMGINGKQVFFAKKINGKITHNKELEENSKIIQNQQPEKKEELYIEFKNIKVKDNNTNVSENKKREKNKQNTQNKMQNNNLNEKLNKKININSNKNGKANKKNKNKRKIARKKNRRILKISLLFFIIVGMAAFIFVSPVFNISKIEVKGNEIISSDTIISLSGIKENENIFRISKKNINNRLKENPYIKDVTIGRKLPGTLELNIDERKIAYQVKVINSYVYLDYQGYILEVSEKQKDVPIVEGFNTDQESILKANRLSGVDIEHLKVLLKIMENAQKNEISKLINKIIIKDNEYILDIKNEKKTVYLGNAKDITNQMYYVKLILEKEKDNEGKIFVNGNINSGFKPYFREGEK